MTERALRWAVLVAAVIGTWALILTPIYMHGHPPSP